jgi:hypothetical protein
MHPSWVMTSPLLHLPPLPITIWYLLGVAISMADVMSSVWCVCVRDARSASISLGVSNMVLGEFYLISLHYNIHIHMYIYNIVEEKFSYNPVFLPTLTYDKCTLYYYYV